MKNAADSFHAFVTASHSFAPRLEIKIDSVPAPQKLAPLAFAMTGDVALDERDDIATGRFVLLCDPQGQEAWDGEFRCVTFVRAAIEDDLQSDPLLPEVGWSWVNEALRENHAEFRAPSGTVTRVSSASFGQMSSSENSSEIEIRASWTPANPKNLINHLRAWASLLGIASGLTPLPDGVASLKQRR